MTHPTNKRKLFGTNPYLRGTSTLTPSDFLPCQHRSDLLTNTETSERIQKGLAVKSQFSIFAISIEPSHTVAPPNEVLPTYQLSLTLQNFIILFPTHHNMTCHLFIL